MTHPLEKLPEEIYQLLADDNHHVANEENVEWAGEVFKDLLRRRLTKREEVRGEEVLRFSSLGKKDRQLWLAANEPECFEKTSGKQNFKYLYGDVLEVLMLFLAREAGHDVKDTQREVEVDGVKGHIDATIDGVLVDAKSASSPSYEKFKSGSYLFDDPFGYVTQLSGYANALGVTDAGFLVCDKQHGDIIFVPLDKEYIEGITPEERIAHFKEVINSPDIPDYCHKPVPEGKSGNMKLDIPCAYCAAKERCWKDANGGKGLRKFMYSKGPVWLTKVSKEPRVEEDN